MELSESAVSRGLWRPLGRLILLGLVSYLAAVIHPLPESLWDLLIRPLIHPEREFSFDGFRAFDWNVFPLFDGLGSDLFLIYLPVMIFSVVCCAMDRWENSPVLLLASITTFSFYAIGDIVGAWGLLPRNCLLLAIVAAQLLYIRRSAASYPE